MNVTKSIFSNVRVSNQNEAEILERTRASVERRKVREAVASHIQAIGYTQKKAAAIVLVMAARNELTEILIKNKQLTAEEVQAVIVKYNVQFS